MLDPDSLVATRSRRANAGANLRRLIDLEEQASGGNNIVYTGDDENVELLFQEDENDVEFEESASENDDQSEQNSDEEGEEESDRDETKADVSENEQDVNSDEMLSDSDLSASDNDDSEGERDLQKREREIKRKKKPQPVIPAIKKPRIQAPRPKPSQPQTKHSELLLTHDRRASSRKSALKNKETLVKKLKEDESRRAALSPVVRVKERKLTQEERLAQAVETERENVKSLHSFLEQEIVKKERQKLLFQQRRLKLRDVVRLSSKLSYMSPLDEIEDARYVHSMIEKRRKGRRRRAAGEVIENVIVPGTVDTSLPYYKEEMASKKLEEDAAEKDEQLEKTKEDPEESQLENTKEDSEESQVEKKQDETSVPPENSPSGTEDAASSDNPAIKVEANEESDVPEISSTTKNDEGEQGSSNGLRNGSESGSDIHSNEGQEVETDLVTENLESKTEISEEKADNTDQAAINVSTEPETLDDANESTKTKTKESSPHESQTEEAASDAKLETDKIEDEEIKPEEDVEDGEEEEILRREDADGSIFEGPPQLVSRNYVSLIEFENERVLPLANNKVKVILFGEGANSGASRRLRDVKTILKSSLRSDNPYSVPKEEKEDELMKPVTEIDEEDSIFEALRRVPRLGTKEIFEELEEDDQKEEATAVEIRTEAPTGLYLPNENKKLCLINGKEVRYFDPATGVPYDNKKGYQIIKSIESGVIPWLSLAKDQNNYGEVEIYINRREGARHAKGVPEGFDGF